MNQCMLSIIITCLLSMSLQTSFALTPNEENLQRAARLGNINAVHDLLKKNVNVNATDAQGNTALHYAAQENQAPIVTILLDHGAISMPNNGGKKPSDLIREKNPFLADTLDQAHPLWIH
jgi:ankyrin repeat protein